MKKGRWFILILCFLVFTFTGIAHSWQGRMAGMGDPYGLIEDESDFLIHPSGMAKGEGLKFYGHYRFIYRDVNDWDYTLDRFNTAGVLSLDLPHKSSGDEREHDALFGAAFPLGPGRMGLFFKYAGKDNDYSGSENEWRSGTLYFHQYNFRSDVDEFALRLLYGLPMGGFKLGGEIQLAHRGEENGIFFNGDQGGGVRRLWWNNPFGEEDPQRNLFPFIFPFDSQYWEALFKSSVGGAIGPAEISFTMRGGFIFNGDNDYDFTRLQSSILRGGKMDGNIKGWSIGGDLFLRYPLGKDLSLPFLLKIEYQKKTRDGDGVGFSSTGSGLYAGDPFNYKNNEKIFQSEVGGGVDKSLARGTKIAAGIYYGYFQNKNDFSIIQRSGGTVFFWDHANYPDHTEHQVILKLSGEKELSPLIALRMGLNFFYGWVDEDYKLNTSPSGGGNPHLNNNSLDGTHWGIGLSLGGTVKFQQLSFEPFLGAGYQKLNLDGGGSQTGPTIPVRSYEMEKTRKDWSIGGGLSIKF